MSFWARQTLRHLVSVLSTGAAVAAGLWRSNIMGAITHTACSYFIIPLAAFWEGTDKQTWGSFSEIIRATGCPQCPQPKSSRVRSVPRLSQMHILSSCSPASVLLFDLIQRFFSFDLRAILESLIPSPLSLNFFLNLAIDSYQLNGFLGKYKKPKRRVRFLLN